MDLAELFSAKNGILLLDKNGDGLTDSLNALIIVPEKATAEEAAAAANIGARLGFETMGLDLPLAVTDTYRGDLKTPIIIGKTNDVVSKELKGKEHFKHLRPGHGTIQTTSFASVSAILVRGADGVGTLAASHYFSGRLPYIWSVGEDQLTLGNVKKAVLDYLGNSIVKTSITRVEVESCKAGLSEVWVEAKAATERGANKANQALLTLKEGSELRFERIKLLIIDITYNGFSFRTCLHNEKEIPSSMPFQLPVCDLKAYDLSSLYGNWDQLFEKNDGLLTDTPKNQPFLEDLGIIKGQVKDFTPDNVAATIITAEGGGAAAAATNFTARLGLESTGIQLPVAYTVEGISDICEIKYPVLFGTSDHPLIGNLQQRGKIDLTSLNPGEGMVSIVKEAWGINHALIIAAQDEAGLASVADFVARRLPYLWEAERGYTTISDIVDSVQDFFSVKTASGQAAEAILRVDELLENNRDIDKLDLTVYLDLPFGKNTDEAFAGFLEDRITSLLPDAVVRVRVKAMKDPYNVFTYEWTDAGEIAEFRKLYSSVACLVGDGMGTMIEVRLSEPPEVLDALQAELQSSAPNAKVVVISAYKQGFSWLTREVQPEIEGRPIERIEISFQEFYEDGVNSSNWRHWRDAWDDSNITWMDLWTRWLMEIYPIDDHWKNTLGIDRNKVVFKAIKKKDLNTQLAGPTYRVRVTFEDESPPYEGQFSAIYHTRNYHLGSNLKNWKTNPTTGWVRVIKGKETLLNQRIKTDPERYWDYFQDKLWPEVKKYILETTNGVPTPEKQPFFREFEHQVWMSEPNYRLNVREELISTLEALHEDIYFVINDYVAELMGNKFPDWLTAPGMIMPLIRDGEPGSAPRAIIKLNAYNAKEPKIDVQINNKKAFEVPITGINIKRPNAISAMIKSEVKEVYKLHLQTPVDNKANKKKADSMLAALREVNMAGVFIKGLSWARLSELCIETAEEMPGQGIAIPKTSTFPVQKVISPVAEITLSPSGSLVRWDGPLSYEESNAILVELDKRPEVNVWPSEKTFLGRQVYVADIMLPLEAELWSQAKASTWKATLMITSAVHANEKSSVSACLRLLENLSADPVLNDYLKRVNIVVVPMDNVDGAIVHHKLQKEQPTWMHHAARFNAAGTDLSYHCVKPNTLYRDSLVRTKVWRTWLPDIYVDNHGYPNHEWVQQFSGYACPGFPYLYLPPSSVRILMRGAGITNMHGREIPEQQSVINTLLREIYSYYIEYPDIMEKMVDMKDRYYVYGTQLLSDIFEHYQHYGPRGELRVEYSKAEYNPPFVGIRFSRWYPWITILRWTTEVADETAQGEVMNMAARLQYYCNLAQIKLLNDAEHHLQRRESEIHGTVKLETYRMRPVTPYSYP